MSEILERVSNILLRPKEFYQSLTKETGVGKAFKYYAVISLFGYAASYLVAYLMGSFMTSWYSRFNPPGLEAQSASLGFGFYLIMAVVMYILGLGSRFLAAAIMSAWLWLWGGRQGYAKAFQLSVYSTTPGVLLSWFPYLGGIVGGIWSLVSVVIGTRQMYKFSTRKAIIVQVLPILIIIGISFAIGIAIVSFYMNSNQPFSLD